MLPIDKYVEQFDDCVKYLENGETLYSVSQVLQKAQHVVLEYGIYNNAWKKWTMKATYIKTWIKSKKLFTNEYHDLNLI